MKTKLKVICFILIAVSLIGIACVCTYRSNTGTLNRMMDDFTASIAADAGVELVDTVSTYGKLNGNGNGIQYFGAVLVKASSENDVSEIVGKLSPEYEIVGYSLQTEQEINAKYLEHVSLRFDDFTVNSEENYYQIFFYCSDSEGSDGSDIAGH